MVTIFNHPFYLFPPIQRSWKKTSKQPCWLLWSRDWTLTRIVRAGTEWHMFEYCNLMSKRRQISTTPLNNRNNTPLWSTCSSFILGWVHYSLSYLILFIKRIPQRVSSNSENHSEFEIDLVCNFISLINVTFLFFSVFIIIAQEPLNNSARILSNCSQKPSCWELFKKKKVLWSG